MLIPSVSDMTVMLQECTCLHSAHIYKISRRQAAHRCCGQLLHCSVKIEQSDTSKKHAPNPLPMALYEKVRSAT